MTRVFAVVALAASATCSPKPDPLPFDIVRPDAGMPDGGVTDCDTCASWDLPEILGPLPMSIDELSGLAASIAHPGVVYAHNDSGDSARFFMLDSHAVQLAELRLPGAFAVDWEDMALGPCGDGDSCLYLGDIGDNNKRRTDYAVYRVREPEPPPPGVEPPSIDLKFERFRFQYPNGTHHNAETLLVHPGSGDVYVLTKENRGLKSRVFKFPQPLKSDDVATLVEVGDLAVPEPSDTQLTGGDIHPCGNALLLRLYNRIVRLEQPSGQPFDAIFSATPVEVPMPIDEPQGEAITWGHDGRSYFTASEMTGQSLHRVGCARAP